MRKNFTQKGACSELSKEISEILVVNDKDLSPYIEVINFSPENIAQKPLGTLLGFFEIKDDNDDSAYIVNFLSSVAKKEYFSNPKRPPVDSFEATLHKINLALSEIAKHNNVSWIGKLEVALCVVTKSYIHFSVTGEAKILLIREGEMFEISEGLTSEEASLNPMKTFIDISSGKLMDNDKIIATSEDMFHVLSRKELKEGANAFSNNKFVQFIRTALINELSIAGAVIIDFAEKEISPKPQSSQRLQQAGELNYFSQSAFRNGRPIPTGARKEYRKETGTFHEEYTDQKTGHIYLKDDQLPISENGFSEKLQTRLNEKMFDFSYWLKENFLNKLKRTSLKNIVYSVSQKSMECKDGLVSIAKAITKKEPAERDFLNEEGDEENNEPLVSDEAVLRQNATQKTSENPELVLPRLSEGIYSLTPSPSRIKAIFLSMQRKQKVIAILLVILIIIAPLIFNGIAKKRAKNSSAPQVLSAKTESPEQKLSGEKFIQFYSGANSIYSQKNIHLVKKINEELFVVTEDKFLVFENDALKKEFLFPEEYSKAFVVTYMDSLNLFFVLTDKNQLLAFSSHSKKFQQNTIAIPENSNIKSMGAYLTYLYLADEANNQIYRYPRTDGGFGEKTSWLKEDIDLKNLTDMSIGEKIILSFGDQSSISLLKGEQSDFSFEIPKTPYSFDKTHLESEAEKFYALDKKNSRIIRFNSQGQIEKQIYQEKIIGANGFGIDAEENIYIFDQNGLYKLNK